MYRMLNNMCQNHMMIDLHGRTVKETKKILEEQFLKIKEQNITDIYIITGRGNHVAPDGNRGVLKKVLPKLLKPYCDEITQIDPEIGSYRITLKHRSLEAIDTLKTMATIALGTADENVHRDYIHALEQKAQKDDVDALLGVACAHLNGLFPGINDTLKAIEFINKAKELGSLEAYVLLGELYLKGKGVKQNYKKAIELLEYAANKDDAHGQLRLAECYVHGRGVKLDDQQALYWTERSAKLGNVSAMYNLGYSYFMGEFTKRNDELAVKYLTAAAAYEHPHAKAYLARCYACGYGVRQDTAKAFSLYQQAAVYDDIYAIYQVGQYYSDGRAGEVNKKEAFKYFQRGASLGDIDCQVKVGQAYLFELGVKRDIPQGIKLIKEGVAKKNPGAYYIMAHAHRHGLGVEKNAQEEQKLLALAATEGLADAQFELGLNCLVADKGVPENLELGIDWLKKAAEKNHKKALHLLEKLAQDENIVSKKNLKPESIVPLIQHSMFKANEPAQPDKKASAAAIKTDKCDTNFAGLRKGFFR